MISTIHASVTFRTIAGVSDISQRELDIFHDARARGAQPDALFVHTHDAGDIRKARNRETEVITVHSQQAQQLS